MNEGATWSVVLGLMDVADCLVIVLHQLAWPDFLSCLRVCKVMHACARSLFAAKLAERLRELVRPLAELTLTMPNFYGETYLDFTLGPATVPIAFNSPESRDGCHRYNFRDDFLSTGDVHGTYDSLNSNDIPHRKLGAIDLRNDSAILLWAFVGYVVGDRELSKRMLNTWGNPAFHCMRVAFLGPESGPVKLAWAGGPVCIAQLDQMVEAVCAGIRKRGEVRLNYTWSTRVVFMHLAMVAAALAETAAAAAPADAETVQSALSALVDPLIPPLRTADFRRAARNLLDSPMPASVGLSQLVH